MPRIKKTSSQPKRKPKPPIKIVRPIYPEYIENFIREVESKTPFTVKIDKYGEKETYHIGVNKKEGKTHRCLWMASYVTEAEHLVHFWTSAVIQNMNNKSI